MKFKIVIPFLALFLTHNTIAAMPNSIGVIEFGDENTLFVADPDGGQIFAYILKSEPTTGESASYNLLDFGQVVAEKLGVSEQDISYHDIATHPVTGEIWIALTMIAEQKSQSALVRTNTSGEITIVDLSKLSKTSKQIKNTADDGVKFWRDIPATTLAITDLDYVDGILYVSGLSTGEFASTLRQIPYPFEDTNDTTHIEIYHTVHDQIETRAPIRAMTVLDLNGEQTIVAAYTCTPLVTIPTKDLKDGAHVRGKTVAELGYGNTPLDVLQFSALNEQQEPEDYVLIVHKERNADLIRVKDLIVANQKESLSTPEMWGHAGVPSRPLPLSGVLQVADQDAQYIVTLKRNIETGDIDLVSFRKGAYFRLSDFISEYNFPDYEYPVEQDFFREFQNMLKTDAGFSDLARDRAL